MARVVVVGGGLGGIASAARLAKLGHAVTVLERRDRLGGAIGFLEQDGYRWDTGPTSTVLPAVLRDLFRKSGRRLEDELDLVPLEPMSQHRFEDGEVVDMPTGRAGAKQALDEGLGAGAGERWLRYVDGFADQWDVLRNGYLENPYSPERAGHDIRRLLATRDTMHRAVGRGFKDERLRSLATSQVMIDGQDPRNVPAWMGAITYIEQKLGRWTVRGGMGVLAQALTYRLAERGVDVRLDTRVEDIVVREQRAVGVAADEGTFEADIVVCAVDPRLLPTLAPAVRKTTPAIPPVLCHLGLGGGVPDLPAEVVLHGDPLLVVRTGGTAPEGRHAWTLLGRGQLAEDIVTALARSKIDVREQIEVRVDRSPRELVEAWGGSPMGVLWQGRATLTQRMGTTTALANVLCAGAHAAPGSGLPFVGLGAALVAQSVGRA